MDDSYIYAIAALLPLSACMLVFQANPYHALIIRGILGAVAALVYVVFGAADVALTEALVGTMLSITLYVVAVRSSLVMRLGVLEDPGIQETLEESESTAVPGKEAHPTLPHPFEHLTTDIRSILNKYHMRLELVPYLNNQDLKRALMTKEIHAACMHSPSADAHSEFKYHTSVRVRRLYDILQAELLSTATSLAHVSVPEAEEKHS